MYNQLKIWILGMLLIATASANTQNNIHKKALLVGVGNYPSSTGWNHLSSNNDIHLLKNALEKQGFASEDVCMITDEQATRENIIKTIKTKLVQNVKPGDIVFFHFSGHGQQKADSDGDEIDGYDECLVPFDSPKKYEEGVYEGQNLITDDELNSMFKDVRKQLGPKGHLLVSLDACHSGTGTRGIAIGRGSTEPMASQAYIHNKISNRPKENNQLNNENNTALAPMIAFFGSAQNQMNYEWTNDQGEQFGSLSYSLAKYLVQLNKDESYRGLFDKIKIEMSGIAPLQQPQAEGDLDIEVFNGRSLGSALYYKVISTPEDEHILINAGYLQDIQAGTSIGFFSAETRDIEQTKPIATGKIVKNMATSSEVILDSTVEPELLQNTWVYVIEKNFGDLKIAIRLKIADDILSQRFTEKLFSYPYISNDPDHAILNIEQSKPKSYIIIRTIDDYLLDSISSSNPELAISKMRRSIIRYIQGQSIRKLEMKSDELNVSFKIIPVNAKNESLSIDSLIPVQTDASGIVQMKIGENFQILIINNGWKPAYFNFLDLQPDNKINFMFPWKDQTADEMKILPGQKKLMPKKWEVVEPFGTEIFKLVASSKPLDLRTAYGTRGQTSQNPFEKFFSELENEESYTTRGSKPLPLGSMDIHIYSESFIIAK
jgi:hypothetical protein